MSNQHIEGVSLLGNQSVKYPTEYSPSILEAFHNIHPESNDIVSLDCFEFSSLCPKTGQPDMGTIHISYIPNEKMVESKSLKLYLFSFRNHGAFHESCVKLICDDLVNLLHPKYLEVFGDFNSRGGISILPFSTYATEEYRDFEINRKLAVMNQMMTHIVRSSR